jgi:hypothetical protein
VKYSVVIYHYPLTRRLLYVQRYDTNLHAMTRYTG